MDIQASVGRRQGRNSQNRALDQEIVRTFLNRIPAAQGGAGGSLRERIVDGMCSDALYEAILRFQRVHLGVQADGHIDPHGRTITSLNRLGLQSPQHPAVIRALPATPIAPLRAPRPHDALPDGGSIVDTRAARLRMMWSNFVNATRDALRHNPNSAAVMAYLDRVERSAGSNVPSITETVAFGDGTSESSFSSRHNAYVMHVGSRFGTFEGNDALMLLPPPPNEAGGRLLRLEAHTLIVLHGQYSYQVAGRANASDIRLENGNLRDFLGQLARR
jgi:hypothetical protein